MLFLTKIVAPIVTPLQGLPVELNGMLVLVNTIGHLKQGSRNKGDKGGLCLYKKNFLPVLRIFEERESLPVTGRCSIQRSSRSSLLTDIVSPLGALPASALSDLISSDGKLPSSILHAESWSCTVETSPAWSFSHETICSTT